MTKHKPIEITWAILAILSWLVGTGLGHILFY